MCCCSSCDATYRCHGWLGRKHSLLFWTGPRLNLWHREILMKPECFWTFLATDTNRKWFEMRFTARPSVSRAPYNKTSHFHAMPCMFVTLTLIWWVLYSTICHLCEIYPPLNSDNVLLLLHLTRKDLAIKIRLSNRVM